MRIPQAQTSTQSGFTASPELSRLHPVVIGSGDRHYMVYLGFGVHIFFATPGNTELFLYG